MWTSRLRWGRGLLWVCIFLLLGFDGVHAQSTSEDARTLRLLDTYRKMLDEDPSADYPYRRLLEVSHVRGGVKGLIALYRKSLDSKKSRYARWMVLGHLYRTSDKDKDAQAAYLKAAEYSKKKAAPYVALAKLHKAQRRWSQALDFFDQAIGLARGKDAKQEILKAASETAMESKDVERSESYFKKLVKTAPGNLFLRMEYASNLARSGHKERALSLWLNLKKRSKKDLKNLVIVLREIAELQTVLKQYEEAEQTWREGLSRLQEGHWARSTFLEGLIGLHRRQDRLGELIKSWLPKTRKSYQILVTVARLYEELANDSEALKLYQMAVKRRPSDANTRLQVIRLLERVGKMKEVITAYRALIKATRGEARYEIRLAELYFTRGRTKDGLAMLDKLSRGYKTDPGVHQSVIDLLVRYGNRRAHKKIEAEYKLLMRLEPREESHPISLGELYWSKGDRKKALSTWRKLLQVARRKAEGYFLLAEVYANHNMTSEANTAFQEAIRLDPKNPRYLQAYALLLEKNRKFKKALSQWKRVLTESGKRHVIFSREARRRMISLWKRNGRLELEISRMEGEFAREPLDPDVGSFLGAVYLNLRRRKDAERVFSRILNVHPNHVDALAGLELVLTRQNKLKEAIDVLFRLATANSKGASEYMHRAADLALSLGRQEQALDCMRKVVELNPADPMAHTRVAELHQRMGSLNQAAEAWRQALLLDPRNYRNQFQLAAIYRELGNAIREEQVLAEIVRTAHEPSDVLKAGRQLLSVAVTTDRVDAMEEIVRPLVFNRRNRDIYLRLLVDVYGALARSYAYGQPDKNSAQLLKDLGGRALKPLLDGLLSADVTLRNKALDVIALTRPLAVGNALGRLVQTQDRELQFRAALVLGRLQTEGATRELRKLVSSSSRELRRLAVWSLGHVKSQDAIELLSDILRTGSIDLRPYAALALGQAGDGAHRLLLEELVTKRPAAITRLAALWSLGRIASKDSFSVLQQASASTRKKGGSPRQEQELLRERTLIAWAMGRTRPPVLNKELLESVWANQGGSTRGLGQCLRHQATPDEERSLNWSYSSFVDHSSMRFLHKQMRFVLELPRCSPRTDQQMLTELQPLRRELQIFIKAELEGGRGLSETLLRSFLGEGTGLTFRPILSGEPEAGTQAFVHGLLEPSLAAIARLASGVDGDTSQGLALMLLSRLPKQVRAAKMTDELEQIGLGGLHSRDGSVRRASAKLLLSMSPLSKPSEMLMAVQEALRTARSSSDIALRAECAKLVGAHMSSERVFQVVALLHDEAATVRLSMVRSLDGRDHRALFSALRTLLNDSVAVVRTAVVQLLKNSPYPEAKRILQRGSGHLDATPLAPRER